MNGSRIVACAAVLVGGIALTASANMIDRFHPPPLARALDISPEIVDRSGRLLRAYANREGRWRLAVDPDAVDPRFIDMLIAYEDGRFWRHRGVDPLAMARAFWQLARHGRAVSGASTITMQLAALLEPAGRGTIAGKVRQIVRAIQIERRLSKREILAHYLTLAPYGGNIEGVRAAALTYFGREARHLPPAMAALLVALPQAPEARRPDRHAATARDARDRVLERMVDAGILDPAVATAAQAREGPRHRKAFPFLAAHAGDRLRAGSPKQARIVTTVDAGWQQALEDLAARHAAVHGPLVSAAILVADHATGEIRATVGSAGYFDEARSGANDMTRAVRSPGSTLKPLIYGLAFDAGLAHPETLVEDRPSRFARYAPRNFDLDFQGTVTIREALAQSLNIPAVAVLDAVGPQRLIAHMRRAGLEARLPEGKPAGLAIGLGGIGLTLTDLTRLFVAIARGGSPMTLVLNSGEPTAQPDAVDQPVLSAVAAAQLTGILRTTPPPASAAGGRIAFKTGTSYGYRDAWSVGYDGRHVITVWIGRPDGAPVSSLTGQTAAAPLLFEAFARLSDRPAPFNAPPGLPADPPPGLERFAGTAAPAGRIAAAPLAIAFPPDGADLRAPRQGRRPTMLRAEGGVLPLAWFANGRPIGTSRLRRQLDWVPDGPGYTTFAVIDAAGETRRSTVFVGDRRKRSGSILVSR